MLQETPPIVAIKLILIKPHYETAGGKKVASSLHKPIYPSHPILLKNPLFVYKKTNRLYDYGRFLSDQGLVNRYIKAIIFLLIYIKKGIVI